MLAFIKYRLWSEKGFLMKRLFSKRPSHEKEHHHFISLILLSLGLVSLVYILAFCHLPDKGKASLIYHASAREKEQESENNDISEAVFLSRNSIHQISLSPYNHRYYYAIFQENSTLKILSGGSSIRVTVYSPNGEKLNIHKKNHQYHIEKVSGDALSPGDRIFFKFASVSTKPCSIKVQFKQSSAKKASNKNTATPKPRKTTSRPKKTTSKPRKATSRPKKATSNPGKAASRPKKATSKSTPKATSAANKIIHATPAPSPIPQNTAPATPKPSPAAKKKVPKQTLHVRPHFLQLPAGAKKELSLSLGKSPLPLSDCTYFLTDPSLVSIQGNTVLGKKEGISILYFRTKKAALSGSCLIRITKSK